MDTQADPAIAPFDPPTPSEAEQRPPSYLIDRPRRFGPIPDLVSDDPPPTSQQEPETTAVDQSDAASELAVEPSDDPVATGKSDADTASRPAVLELIEAASGIDGKRPDNLAATIESLLFVAEEPPSVRQLAEATNVPKDAVEEALDRLEQDGATRGIRLQRNGSKVRLVSAPESAPWIERLLGLERPNKLSKASLETLAIVAYRQPITRLGVEKVRGVSCDGPFQTLRSRDLIEPVGQVDGPGRPNLWAVTDRFLDHFSLRTLAELPPLPLLQGRPAQQGKLEVPETDSDAAEPQPLAAPADQPAGPEQAPQQTATQFAAAGGSGD
jgi:segregation and condensation protein B